MSDALLVFGGGGFVGGNLCALALEGGWQVHVADPSVRDALRGATWHTVDVTREADVRSLVASIRPSAVVDLAAVADVDRAEREPDLARAVNTEAAGVIASACTQVGSRCIYFSSDAVFPGTAQRYVEDDPPQPVNWYGRTKADGEKAVREACSEAVLVRISLVLGFPVTDGNSFLAALEKKLGSGAVVSCPVDEIRTPIDVQSLASCVLEVCRNDVQGPLHLGSTNSVDRYTLTRRAAARMGFPDTQVVPQPPGTVVAGRAARHARGVISVERARSVLETPFHDWEKSLERAFETRPTGRR